MPTFWIECNACDASYTADYDAGGFRWMEKHSDTHEDKDPPPLLAHGSEWVSPQPTERLELSVECKGEHPADCAWLPCECSCHQPSEPDHTDGSGA